MHARLPLLLAIFGTLLALASVAVLPPEVAKVKQQLAGVVKSDNSKRLAVTGLPDFIARNLRFSSVDVNASPNENQLDFTTLPPASSSSLSASRSSGSSWPSRNSDVSLVSKNWICQHFENQSPEVVKGMVAFGQLNLGQELVYEATDWDKNDMLVGLKGRKVVKDVVEEAAEEDEDEEDK
ncbi:hypothetical protein BJ742DRAFT_768470 [Cladochytrium replicatum]|nr:hypothetical protein BJ742DRAFT_768470 [Cladochytrium replicatum]